MFRISLAYSEPAPGRTAENLREHGVDETLYIADVEIVSLAQVRDVRLRSMEGGPALSVVLTSEGRSRLAAASSRHVGKKMAMFVDGKLYSTPIVQAAITNGEFYLWGGTLTEQQLEDLAKRFRAALGYG